MQYQSKHIEISVPDQRARIWENDQLIREYPVSTSKFGLGSEEGSFKTPLGRFRICEKIGNSAETGTIFKGRRPVGVWRPGDAEEEDMILSRILRLDGLDPGNANSLQRYIYIHGTNDEKTIGIPASHGCVRMKNTDIIALFDDIQEGTTVTISNAPSQTTD